MTIRSSAVADVSPAEWRTLARRARSEAQPFVIRAALPEETVTDWTPQHFASRFAGRTYAIAVGLPDDEIPYERPVREHLRSASVGELVAMMDAEIPCYLNQVRAREFAEFTRDLDLSQLEVAPVFGLNLWIGFGTRSGLHYDRADNMLLQIFGTKHVTLFAPRDTARLAPLSDNPSKSAVNIHAVEPRHRAKLARCTALTTSIGPRDALFIPRGWWHEVTATGPSISVNCWHGNSLTDGERLRRILAPGPRIAVRALRDFVVHGMWGQPYRARMFCPKPLGLELFERVSGIRRKQNK